MRPQRRLGAPKKQEEAETAVSRGRLLRGKRRSRLDVIVEGFNLDYFVNLLINPERPTRPKPNRNNMTGSVAVRYQMSMKSVGMAFAIPATPKTSITANNNTTSIFIMILPFTSLQIWTPTLVTRASQL